MKSFGYPAALQALCRDARSPGAFVSISTAKADLELDELRRAAPWFDPMRDGQLYFDHEGFLLFDSEEEMQTAFDITVGDGGPTVINGYVGPVSVYMLTCSANGELRNENS